MLNVIIAPMGASYRVARTAGRLFPNTANAELLKIKKA
mgnify:CR=1 FL=1